MENLYNPKPSFEFGKIDASACFEALNEKEKLILDESATWVDFKKGEVILKEGFAATHIMYMEKGLAALRVTNDNQQSTVSLIKANSFIGIICTFACRNLNFSATALEETRVKIIDINLFNSFVKHNGEFALRIMYHMSDITNHIVHWLTRLKNKNIDGALAILLLDFQSLYESDKFSVPFTRKEMAGMIGYSKESLINTLSKFNKEGIIKVSEKKIQILQSDALKRIAKTG
ncbi:Crp/Fnr family transcriptional regulator [Marinilabiliaceae bacterium JC017]|nr:Crp/Fnr family transcriptional regulator [Marinilabiliaceae bacterium JC017]